MWFSFEDFFLKNFIKHLFKQDNEWILWPKCFPSFCITFPSFWQKMDSDDKKIFSVKLIQFSTNFRTSESVYPLEHVASIGTSENQIEQCLENTREYRVRFSIPALIASLIMQHEIEHCHEEGSLCIIYSQLEIVLMFASICNCYW